jgi:protein-tyrosine phosphatase
MDITWITPQLGLGGGIWNDAKMAQVADAGITHVINLQTEFDDRSLAKPYNIDVLWNATDDDFQPKSPEFLKRGVDFALDAMKEKKNKIFIHCAAGVHRAPMMTLAVMGAMGYDLRQSQTTIQRMRPVVDWAAVYVASVEKFIREYDRVAESKWLPVAP